MKFMRLLIGLATLMSFGFEIGYAARPALELATPQISSDLRNAIQAVESHIGHPLNLTESQLQQLASNERALNQGTQTATLDGMTPVRRFYCFGVELAVGWHLNGAVCADGSGTVASLGAVVLAGVKANLAASIVDVKGRYVFEGDSYRGSYSRPVGGSFSWFVGGQVIHFRHFESRGAWNMEQALSMYSLLGGFGASINVSDLNGFLGVTLD